MKSLISTELQQVLKVNNEPLTCISDSQVHTLLSDNPITYLRFTLQRLSAIANGKAKMVLPPKQLLEDSQGQGDFRSMPCITEYQGETTKSVKVVGTNLRQIEIPKQITVGKALALHPQENYITHLFDACILSSARTGLCATIGQQLLCPDMQTLCIVGCGRVGYYSALYMLAASSVTELTLVDTNLEQAFALRHVLLQAYPDVQISVSDHICPTAQVISLATDSKSAILSPENTNAELVISLGADCDDQSELNEAWQDYDLFVDNKDSAHFGDLKRWQAAGKAQDNQLTDIFSLLRTEHKPSMRKRAYISTGSALFDNLTIAFILQNL